MLIGENEISNLGFFIQTKFKFNSDASAECDKFNTRDRELLMNFDKENPNYSVDWISPCKFIDDCETFIIS